MFGLVFPAGCQTQDDSSINEVEAVARANAYISRTLPQVPLRRLRIVTNELETEWRVSYHPPYDATGGPMVLLIDKKTRAITDFAMDQ